jgi:hypothetical protein
MGGVGPGEHDGPRGHALLSHAVVYVGGREQAETRVMVLGVVLMRVISSSLLWVG